MMSWPSPKREVEDKELLLPVSHRDDEEGTETVQEMWEDAVEYEPFRLVSLSR